ncbi:MAG: hypothetical protein ABJA84_05675 [Polaromonas sp.]
MARHDVVYYTQGVDITTGQLSTFDDFQGNTMKTQLHIPSLPPVGSFAALDAALREAA